MIGYRWGWIVGVYGVLFVAGFGYNALVSYLERRGYDDGFTAPLVVVGVLFTIGGVALVDWRAALLTLGAFAASGFWMVIGSWWRHVTARRHSQEALRSEALLPERESGEE